ncbi:MAG TPA: transglutaminase domain-containing protein [Planctomycetota bacterium]|nr:transglutaminase domain-containing protein [Planctomycetota bacterium]
MRRIIPTATIAFLLLLGAPAATWCAETVAEADAAAAAETLEVDRWYVGNLNGQPAATMHAVVMRREDGTRRTRDDMVLVIQRKLGAQSIAIEMRQGMEFIEDAAGVITEFSFDQEENGQRTTALGTIEGDAVVATVHRLGRADAQRAVIPPGAKLLGQKASQELMAGGELAVGQKIVSAAPQLISGSIVVVTSTATYKGPSDAGRVFEVVADVMPIPMKVVIDAQGELVSMSLNLGFFAIEFLPSDGPVVLKPAELASSGLVAAEGPAPVPRAENRYRLPATALDALPADPFQRRDGELLVVAAGARVEEPEDVADLLQAEPQLELDDAALRAWVMDTVAKAKAGGAADEAGIAEQLRLAVRGHIRHKDLGKGDASALEAFRDQRGDCSEHANLLCATLRIAGIPARTEVGLVYAADFGGWVGHAWNSAWVGGGWVHLDSAYPGIMRSQYIKLACSSGRDAPSTLAALVTALAQVLGKSVETLP